MNGRLCVLVGVVVLAGLQAAVARQWTDTSGQQTEAKFVRVFKGNVILTRGGRVLQVPFSTLCAEDQTYVRQKLEAKGQNDLLPPVRSESAFTPNSDAAKTPEPGPTRTWTDLRGRKIQAQFVDLSGTNVVLLKDGAEVSLAMAVLSVADRQYIQRQLQTRKLDRRPSRPATPPPPRHGSPSFPRIPSPRIPSPPPAPKMPHFEPPPPIEIPKIEPPKPPDPIPSTMGSSHSDRPSAHRPLSMPTTMPTMSPQSFRTPTMDRTGPTEYGGVCGKCGMPVRSNIGAGDNCPHCGVHFDYEEREDGTMVDAKGKTIPHWWAKIGGGGGAVVAVFVLMRLFLAFRRSG